MSFFLLKNKDERKKTSRKNAYFLCFYIPSHMIAQKHTILFFPHHWRMSISKYKYMYITKVYCSCQKGVLKLSIFTLERKEVKINMLVKRFCDSQSVRMILTQKYILAFCPKKRFHFYHIPRSCRANVNFYVYTFH